MRLLSICLGVVLVVGMLGCSRPVIRGRVIEGPVNVTTLVDEGDKRLSDDEAEGVGGASVEIIAVGLPSPARVQTDRDGSFKATLSKKASVTGQLALRVEAEGYLREETSVPFPPREHRILIVLQNR